MNVIKLDELPVFQNPHGVDVKRVFENKSFGVMQILMKPGDELPKHRNSANAIFLVLEGSGLVDVGEEQQKVAKNTLIEIPANELRAWKNDSNELLKILVVKML